MGFSQVLIFHISAGVLGFLTGAGAMVFRKGSPRHRLAGKLFVISMVSLSLSAVYLAVMRNRMIDVFAGLFTFYLVTTAWATARRKAGEKGIFDWAALLFALGLAVGYIGYGLQAQQSPLGMKGGAHAGNYFFMGFVVLLIASGDLRMILSGISETQRLVRHLWRMCFALFMAGASILLARPYVFPDVMRRTGILTLLGFLPLVVMFFWIFRVRLTNEKKPLAHADGAYPVKT